MPVECPECGLRAEVREKAEGGPKIYFEEVLSTCRHKLGNDFLRVPKFEIGALRSASVSANVAKDTTEDAESLHAGEPM